MTSPVSSGGTTTVITQVPAPPSPVPAGAVQRPQGGGQSGGTGPSSSGGSSGGGGKGGGGKSGSGGGKSGGGGKGKGAAPQSKFSKFRKFGPGWKSLKPRSPARPPTRLADAGGFLSGLALYTVAIIYVRYGPEGWKGWLEAKFLNKPMATSATGATGTKPKTKSGGTAAV